MIIAKNNLPSILHERKLNITDLHVLLAREARTRMSYPTVHKLATESEIPTKTTVYSLIKIAIVLNVKLDDLVKVK